MMAALVTISFVIVCSAEFPDMLTTYSFFSFFASSYLLSIVFDMLIGLFPSLK